MPKTHTRKHTHTHTHACTHTHKHTCTNIYTHIQTHMHTQTPIYTYKQPRQLPQNLSLPNAWYSSLCVMATLFSQVCSASCWSRLPFLSLSQWGHSASCTRARFRATLGPVGDASQSLHGLVPFPSGQAVCWTLRYLPSTKCINLLTAWFLT